MEGCVMKAPLIRAPKVMKPVVMKAPKPMKLGLKFK